MTSRQIVNLKCVLMIITLLCQIKGLCKGNMISTEEVEPKEKCLRMCKENVMCRWFTFIAGEESEALCILLHVCLTIDKSCPTCTSGERHCEEEYSTTTVPTSTTSSESMGNIYRFCHLNLIIEMKRVKNILNSVRCTF